MNVAVKSGLIGPYRLTVDGIADAVKERSPGVYALGHQDFNGRFRITHIGRSDKELSQTLRDMIGTSSLFKFLPLATSKEAFEKECELFHKFKPPGSSLHPVRPPGTNWSCPRCMQGSGSW